MKLTLIFVFFIGFHVTILAQEHPPKKDVHERTQRARNRSEKTSDAIKEGEATQPKLTGSNEKKRVRKKGNAQEKAKVNRKQIRAQKRKTTK